MKDTASGGSADKRQILIHILSRTFAAMLAAMMCGLLWHTNGMASIGAGVIFMLLLVNMATEQKPCPTPPQRRQTVTDEK